MGLMVHSLENIPETKNRDYFIYLLDYGWTEPISKVLRENFENMSKFAATNRAVVIKGTELAHFENEVFSWHKINNENADDLLPAMLITNTHPRYFREHLGKWKTSGQLRSDEHDQMKLILIPFKKFCSSPTEAISLINKVFNDIINQRDLSEFKIAKEMKKGIGQAIVNSIILEPNFNGIGFSFEKLLKYLKDGG
ncbi:MAG: hypothetical protein A2252_09635 [Elusimicrobia bacterium RIFOXYA2_FULL_39_19]|nr:MAG: hypothetical protein A2252_09635 [Elusimicrobia bacterium RIFOXYA2_FULL_39_19]